MHIFCKSTFFCTNVLQVMTLKGKKMPKIFLVTANTLQHGYTTSNMQENVTQSHFQLRVKQTLLFKNDVSIGQSILVSW